MDPKWSRFCSFSLSFPKYSWADAEDSDSDSDTSESESEDMMIEYYEEYKDSLSSDQTCNDENPLSDKSDHGGIATSEDDHAEMFGEWAQEERNIVQAVLSKRFCKRTPLSQLVLHKSTVTWAVTKCWNSDGELGSLSDAFDRQDEILWCIMQYSC
jgi:hypothetical protein